LQRREQLVQAYRILPWTFDQSMVPPQWPQGIERLRPVSSPLSRWTIFASFFAFTGSADIIAPIVLLFGIGCPTTVLGLIDPVVIFPVEGLSFRANPHVFKEILE
jgi:hypothetical protein